jgi:hypothetical protein
VSTWPLDPQFSDGEDLTQVEMNSRVTDKLNELRTLIPDPQFVALGRNITPFPIVDNTPTAVTFYDAGILYSAGSLISRPGSGMFETTVSGLWRWSASVVWDVAAGGSGAHHRDLWVLQNGTQPTFRPGHTTDVYPAGAWATATQSAGGPVSTAASDTLQLVLFQNSGLTLNANSILFALERIA